MFIIRYFDNAEKRCMPFYYGGCEGNDNRFDTFEECQKSCPSAFLQADVCQQPLVSGECGDYLERWLDRVLKFELALTFFHIGPSHTFICLKYYFRYYFNKELGTCQQFYYGGCSGNKNNFKTEKTCQSRCSADFSIPVIEDFRLEFCFLPKDQGIR